MTHEGRMARGKANHKAGKFLDNPETLDFLKQGGGKMSEEKPEAPAEKPKEEEKKDAQPAE